MADDKKPTVFFNEVQQSATRNEALQQDLWSTAEDSFAPAGQALGRRISDEAEPLIASEYPEYADRFQDDGGDIVVPEITAKDVAVYAAGMVKSVFKTEQDPDFDFETSPDRDALLEGIPLSLQGSIAQSGSLAAAQRSRLRIMEDLQKGERLMAQRGVSPTLTMLAAGSIDVDLPLTMLTGGGFKAATASRRALQLAEKTGMSPKAAVRTSSMAIGANAGFQAGIIAGGVEAVASDTSDWTVVAESAISGTILGSVLGGAIRSDAHMAVENAHKEFLNQIRTNAPELSRDIDPVDTKTSAPDLGAVVDGPRRAPMVIEDDLPDGSSVGAQQVAGLRPQGGTDLSLDPLGTASAKHQEIVDRASQTLYESGWTARRDAQKEEFWYKVATNPVAGFVTRDYNKLLTSNSKVAQLLAGTVFESASGYGRGAATAATQARTYEGRIMNTVAAVYPDAVSIAARKAGGTNSLGMATDDFLKGFNREVMQRLNKAKLQGMQKALDGATPEMAAAVEAFNVSGKEALNILKGDVLPEHVPAWQHAKSQLEANETAFAQSTAVMNDAAANAAAVQASIDKLASKVDELKQKIAVEQSIIATATDKKKVAAAKRRLKTAETGLLKASDDLKIEQPKAQPILDTHNKAKKDAFDAQQKLLDAEAEVKKYAGRAVDGMEDVPDTDGYMRYTWSPSKIAELVSTGRVAKADLETSLATAYMNAGISDAKTARIIAGALVDRMVSKHADTDTNVANIMSGDGRQFLRRILETKGVPAKTIDDVMNNITGKQEERKRTGYAKFRNDIDLEESIPTTDGSSISIVDLMDHNLLENFQHYSRAASGDAALARAGITNRAQINEMIEAMRAEQRALGEEPIDAERAYAMFSAFFGGPLHGYGFFKGRRNEGISGEISAVMKATNLSLLGKIGVAQLAETGATMAQLGMSRWYQNTIQPWLNKEVARNRDETIRSLQGVFGPIGDDHKVFMPHLGLDDAALGTENRWTMQVNKWLNKGNFALGYVSGLNHVRSIQQKGVVTGLFNDIMFNINEAMTPTGVDSGLLRADKLKRLERDYGLFPEHIQALGDMLEAGDIKMEVLEGAKHPVVTEFNWAALDWQVRQDIAAALMRGQSQGVQHALPGETSAWMHTVWGKVMMHLMSFPMVAVQKQFIRNMQHSDPQAYMTALYGMGTAMVAINVRDIIDNKDRSQKERAIQAFGYSNLTGWIPQVWDPMASALGMNDYRINAYGRHYSWTPPTMDFIDRSFRLGGAVAKTLTGNATGLDKDALRALPFANTVPVSMLVNW